MSKLRRALKWLDNLHRPVLYALVAQFVGQLLWWLSYSWAFAGLVLMVGSTGYGLGWIGGFRRGGDRVSLMYLDGAIRQMEQMEAAAVEELAHNDPRRVQISEQLAEMKRHRRGIPS